MGVMKYRKCSVSLTTRTGHLMRHGSPKISALSPHQSGGNFTIKMTIADQFQYPAFAFTESWKKAFATCYLAFGTMLRVRLVKVPRMLRFGIGCMKGESISIPEVLISVLYTGQIISPCIR